MAARLSTGLVNALMGTDSFRECFALGFIDVYSGTQPTSPDDASGGTPLVTLSSGGTGTGLSWEAAAVSGVLSKLSSETWQGTVAADGVAGWFRLRAAGDTGLLASTTAKRYDGAIGTSGSQMNLGQLSLTAPAPFVISAATFSLPKS